LAPLHGQQQDQEQTSFGAARKRLRRIAADLVHVELEARTQIYAPEDEVQWVYFPSSGMISMLQSTVDSAASS